MKQKNKRLSDILELVQSHSLSSQEELLTLLHKKGHEITQATLSRDIKKLKIIKSPNAEGNYIYTISKENSHKEIPHNLTHPNELIASGFLSLDFSDKLGVIKTRPGYAMGIASDIDNRISHAILGTIAGDDTILLIPREGVERKDIIQALSSLIPELKTN